MLRTIIVPLIYVSLYGAEDDHLNVWKQNGINSTVYFVSITIAFLIRIQNECIDSQGSPFAPKI